MLAVFGYSCMLTVLSSHSVWVFVHVCVLAEWFENRMSIVGPSLVDLFVSCMVMACVADAGLQCTWLLLAPLWV